MIVDIEVLAYVVVASAVLAKLFELVKARVAFFWDKLTPAQKEIGGYVFVLLAFGATWSTGLNMLPGFAAPLGRILTCVAGALGPGAVYDMAFDKPTVTPKPPTT